MSRGICNLCKNKDTRVHFNARRDYYPQAKKDDEFSCTSLDLSNPGEIRKCPSCGYIFTVSHFTEEEVIQKYTRVVDTLHLHEKAARQKTYRVSLDLIEKHVTAPGKLLDIGSYVGFFLEVCREKDWDVSGLEPCVWAAKYSSDTLKLENIVNQTFTPDVYQNQKFDVVTMWDVIEHLFYPAEKMRLVNQLLRQGGLFAFSTHNMDSLMAHFLKDRYPFLMSMHVSHFTVDTLEYLLNKAGFELVEVKTHKRYISLAYLFNRLSRYAPVIAKSRTFFLPDSFARKQLVPISFMGLINVIARKIQEI